eukprot:scaffold53728_cov17-Tisochrysis_lutea.AAC.2
MSIVRQRHVAITSHRARARESKKGCIFGIFGMLPTSAGPFLFADSPIASNSCFVIRWTADKQGIKLVRAVTSCVQLHCNVRALAAALFLAGAQLLPVWTGPMTRKPPAPVAVAARARAPGMAALPQIGGPARKSGSLPHKAAWHPG